jgi:carboxymethylenebutenolidase
MKQRTNPVFGSLFFIMALIASTTPAFYPAYAQTNAAVLSNTTASTPNIITDTTPIINKEGLQIKVKYFDNASGYLTYPSATNISALTGKKLPAVIMIHEFWGINDNIRSMARTLAKQAGYVVLAVDLFKGQSTKDPTYKQL